MNSSPRAIYALLGFLLLASLSSSYIFYKKYHRVVESSVQSSSQEEIQQLVAEVSLLIVLPEGEMPTVATVADPAKLRSQPFFAKAQAGDKVLIYTNARKAILYRPSEKKIIEVAPLVIGNPSAPSSALPSDEASTTANR